MKKFITLGPVLVVCKPKKVADHHMQSNKHNNFFYNIIVSISYTCLHCIKDFAQSNSNCKRAMTFDFQQCGILTSVGSQQPLQPPFKLRNSK